MKQWQWVIEATAKQTLSWNFIIRNSRHGDTTTRHLDMGLNQVVVLDSPKAAARRFRFLRRKLRIWRGCRNLAQPFGRTRVRGVLFAPRIIVLSLVLESQVNNNAKYSKAGQPSGERWTSDCAIHGDAYLLIINAHSLWK